MMTPTPLPSVSGPLAGVAVPGAVYGGLVIHATGAAPARVRIWDNTSASGTLLDVADLTGSGFGSFASHSVGDDGCGVLVCKGIYIEIVTGTAEGSVLVA